MALLGEILHEAGSLRRYPDFVRLAGGPVAGEVPVFVFHTIEPPRFAAQLRYLRDNGYRTIGMDEYLAINEGRVRGSGREVVLTIDDARSSLWRQGYPLLRRHGCKAVTFVITGWTRTEGVRPNLDDVDAGRLTAAQLEALDPHDRDVCTWEELRAMQASGHVEVECHTHLHQRLFAAVEAPTGVVLTNSLRTASDAVFSPYLGVHDTPAALPADAFVGYPLFPTVPLMAGQAAWRMPEEAAAEVAARFRALCATQDEKSAARTLAASNDFRQCGRAAQPLSVEQVAGRIHADLAASQQALRTELRLPQAGVHLCLPFTIGSAAAVQAARALGFRSVLWGANQRRTNLPGSDPFDTTRLKNDFIWRLPGSGRRSLLGLYVEKATRRVAGIAPY